MKHVNLLLLFIVFGITAPAQSFPQMGCDGGDRYVNDVFNATFPPTTVQFGQNTTVAGENVDLMMDIYEPDNDGLAQRPVLIMAFGGSFITGSRGQMESLCREYARKGYVTVAIDYRIYDLPLVPLPDSTDMLEIVVGAVSDMRAAIRQLRMDADNGNPYRIDPNYIFVGGVSAGAIVALHCAYMDADDNFPDHIINEINAQGGLEGNSNPDNLAYSSETQGVVNYFGALNRKDWVDPNDVPVSGIHGTEDDIVPYANGDATVCVFGFCLPIINMDGSSVIHQRALDIGVPSEFTSVEGAGHGDFSNAVYTNFRDDTGFFLHNEVLCGGLTSIEEVREDVSQYVVAFPNPARDQITLDFNHLNRQYDVRVFNSVGQMIDARFGQSDNQLVLTGNQYQPGVYEVFIQFEDAGVLPVSKKVVFMR